jgi:hypothetical protein
MYQLMTQDIFRIVVLTMMALYLGQTVECFIALPIQQKLLLRQQQPSQQQQQPLSVHEDSSLVAFTTSRTASRTRSCLSSAKKDSNNNDTKQLSKKSSRLQDKPGGLILLPFVILFGLDLLLNIIFLTKRSIEFFVLGQAPSQETWF